MRTISTLNTDHIVVRVRRDVDNNEYVVQLHVDGVHNAASDYHTDNRDDALSTADVMLRQAYARLG